MVRGISAVDILNSTKNAAKKVGEHLTENKEAYIAGGLALAGPTAVGLEMHHLLKNQPDSDTFETTASSYMKDNNGNLIFDSNNNPVPSFEGSGVTQFDSNDMPIHIDETPGFELDKVVDKISIDKLPTESIPNDLPIGGLEFDPNDLPIGGLEFDPNDLPINVEDIPGVEEAVGAAIEIINEIL